MQGNPIKDFKKRKNGLFGASDFITSKRKIASRHAHEQKAKGLSTFLDDEKRICYQQMGSV